MEEQKCHADEAGTKGCCTDRIKHRDGKEYKDLVNRLNRIEGQVRGGEEDGGRRTLLCGYLNAGDGSTGGA